MVVEERDTNDKHVQGLIKSSRVSYEAVRRSLITRGILNKTRGNAPYDMVGVLKHDLIPDLNSSICIPYARLEANFLYPVQKLINNYSTSARWI